VITCPFCNCSDVILLPVTKRLTHSPISDILPLCSFARAIRKTKKTGVSYTSYKLVESYRTDQGPRQRVLLTLPELSLPKSEWRKLAIALEARIGGQVSLFEEEPQIALATEQAMLIFDFHQLRKRERAERPSTKEWTTVSYCHDRRTTDYGGCCHNG
jgi:hypothetical protein